MDEKEIKGRFEAARKLYRETACRMDRLSSALRGLGDPKPLTAREKQNLIKLIERM